MSTNQENSQHTSLPVALISATWHAGLVDVAVDSCRAELTARGFTSDAATDHFQVPGSFELPLLARRLAESRKYSAIIAFGLVVDGGIYRHEFVANAVIDGLMKVMLESDVPVFSSVLTPIRFHEHDEHEDFFRRHLAQKGLEVARAAAETLDVHQALPALALAG